MQKIIAEQVELLLQDLKGEDLEEEEDDEEEEDGMQGSPRYHPRRHLLGEGEDDHLEGGGTPMSCGGHTHASMTSSQQNHLRGSTTQGDDRVGSQGLRAGCSTGES